MSKAFERRLWGAAVVLAASALSVVAVRRLEKPTSESAPAYRQKGPANAPIVIAEFSDFQCPACRAAEPGLKSLLNVYDGKVRLIFKNFPIDRLHPWARDASAAAECAGHQEKFWPYHDILYDRQSDWVEAKSPPDKLLAYAKELKLDIPSFQACLKDPATAAAISGDRKEGDDRWVGSTPTFFINQKRFAGSLQIATRGTIWIEKILKK